MLKDSFVKVYSKFRLHFYSKFFEGVQDTTLSFRGLLSYRGKLSFSQHKCRKFSHLFADGVSAVLTFPLPLQNWDTSILKLGFQSILFVSLGEKRKSTNRLKTG